MSIFNALRRRFLDPASNSICSFQYLPHDAKLQALLSIMGRDTCNLIASSINKYNSNWNWKCQQTKCYCTKRYTEKLSPHKMPRKRKYHAYKKISREKCHIALSHTDKMTPEKIQTSNLEVDSPYK